MKIAICGKMCSGKSTLANHIMRTFPGYQKYSFAKRVKELCVELFDMTSAFTGIRILGPNAPLFLSELTDLNIGLDELRNLRSAQSMFLQIYGLIIRNDLINLPTYELFVDRSYALYAFESIMKLAARHNGKLVGIKCMSKLGAVT